MAAFGIARTLFWAALAVVVAQVAALAVILAALGGRAAEIEFARYDGPLVAIEAMTVNVAIVAIVALAIRFGRRSVADYLALQWPSRGWLISGIALTVVVIAILDGVSIAFGWNAISQFQIETFLSARASGWLAALIVALVIAAPVGEEVLYRGFLFRGLARSERAAPLAIFAIALIWAAQHIQYDWFGILHVLLLGLVLGWLRWRSGSTLLAILCHGIVNLVGVVETAFKVNWGMP